MTLAAPVRERQARLKDHDRIVAHMVRALRGAPRHTEPFCHYYVEGFFPDDFYRELLARLPDPRAYAPTNINRWVAADGSSTRDHLQLPSERLRRLDPDAAEFWEGLTAVLSAPELKAMTFEILSPDLERRFRMSASQVQDLPTANKVQLFRELQNYEIEPHPDSKMKYVTTHIYLPRDNAQEDLGTSLYEQVGPLQRLMGRERFREVKRFPFRPNSSYGFVVIKTAGRTSWHGREAIGPGQGVRNSLMNNFMNPAFNRDKEEYS
jgi:hypothetical protein